MTSPGLVKNTIVEEKVFSHCLFLLLLYKAFDDDEENVTENVTSPTFVPTVSLTPKHVVTFSFVEKGTTLVWSATSFKKMTGEKACECRFDGGSTFDADKLSLASFHRCSSAFVVAGAGDEPVGSLFLGHFLSPI